MTITISDFPSFFPRLSHQSFLSLYGSKKTKFHLIATKRMENAFKDPLRAIS